MSESKAEEGPFMCKFCNRTFGVLRSLKRHENVHKGTLHYCEICSKGFTDPWILKRHLQIHDKNGRVKPGVVKYECPQCRITYLSKKDFESHICSGVVQTGWQRRPSKYRHNKLIRSIPDPRMETSHDVEPSHDATPSHDANQFIQINKMSPLQRFPTRSVIQPTTVTGNTAGRAPRRDFLEIPDWRVGFNLSYTCQRCGEPFHESEEWQTILITHLCPF